MNEYEITNFDFSPHLRELLKNYCEMKYEENSITDDWHLWQEYQLLKNNKLNELFVVEYLLNSWKNG
ncbi:hypothetical protein [Flavobacterium salmonis]|uniref:Uncharacterized protein n=1 Tax=Flavobacterium salmonis TaxID=2654844 RepID=A0A6V6ZDE8_9FLAO|nr:hypothetical protein [Flavobacterium salmonis]CAD0008902.1 hypothetical protein FLAT13_04625 [Flavobacterium salmonis]